MRSIQVSTPVFARIWGLRLPGEQSEDAVLRRVLECDEESGLGSATPDPPAPPVSASEVGVLDRRHGVQFPEGFEVFRVYQGREYRARASRGSWVRADGVQCGSLNALSRSIGATTENAWVNWFFIDASGRRAAVTTLRQEREEPPAELPTGREAGHSTEPSEDSEMTWRSDVRRALEQLGGRAALQNIYTQVRAIRRLGGRSLPESLEATIRRTLEDHSSDSMNFRNGPDLFSMPEGKGAGIWALRRVSEANGNFTARAQAALASSPSRPA